MAGSSQRARQGQGSCHVGAGVGVPVVLSGVLIREAELKGGQVIGQNHPKPEIVSGSF